MTQEDPKARQRLDIILAVLGGKLTATQGALELCVSRKTYYEWQARAISAMEAALQDRPGGRPAEASDPQKEALVLEVQTLEKERAVLASRLRIQLAIGQTLAELRSEAPPPKKKRAL